MSIRKPWVAIGGRPQEIPGGDTIPDDALSSNILRATWNAAVNAAGNVLYSVILKAFALFFTDLGNSAGLGTVKLTSSNGPIFKITNNGAFTLQLDWPTAGVFRFAIIQLVNGSSNVITWPTIYWRYGGAGAETTTMSIAGYSLQSSGTNWIFLWTVDSTKTQGWMR